MYFLCPELGIYFAGTSRYILSPMGAVPEYPGNSKLRKYILMCLARKYILKQLFTRLSISC